jgi:hypothetical protein
MSCILRIAGESTAIESFLKTTQLRPYKMWNVGDERVSGNPNLGMHQDSGFNISVSDHDELLQAIQDAVLFLEAWTSELQRLSQTNGIEEPVLDFGLFCGQDSLAHHDLLPARLIHLAGENKIGIELSHYRTNEGLS